MTTKARPLDLVAVDAEPAVVAAAQAVQKVQAEERALFDERHALRIAVNPKTDSSDRRTPLAPPEVREAMDRLAAIETSLRQLRGTKPLAEQQWATARRAAQERLLPECRAHLAPLVDRLWTALNEAATIQAEIDREVTRLNQLLGTPRFQWCGWPSLRAELDARRG